MSGCHSCLRGVPCHCAELCLQSSSMLGFRWPEEAQGEKGKPSELVSSGKLGSFQFHTALHCPREALKKFSFGLEIFQLSHCKLFPLLQRSVVYRRHCAATEALTDLPPCLSWFGAIGSPSWLLGDYHWVPVWSRFWSHSSASPVCSSLAAGCVLHPKPSMIGSHLWRDYLFSCFPLMFQDGLVVFSLPLLSHPPTLVLSWQLRKSWHSSCSYRQMLLAKRVLTPALLPTALTLCSCFLFRSEQCDTHRENGVSLAPGIIPLCASELSGGSLIASVYHQVWAHGCATKYRASQCKSTNHHSLLGALGENQVSLTNAVSLQSKQACKDWGDVSLKCSLMGQRTKLNLQTLLKKLSSVACLRFQCWGTENRQIPGTH